MPSAHCDSSGSSGSGDQIPDFDGVHDLDDVGSLLEHNSIDCGQPMLMPFQLTAQHIQAHAKSDTPDRTPASLLRSIKNQMRLTETLFHFSLGKYILMALLTSVIFPIHALISM